jgi:hypothetical protein
MSNFKPFAQAVHERLTDLSKHELFTTVTGDALWETYLASFPPGTDPIFKVATTHTCTCCKQFIRGMGNVVAIIDGKLASIWDIKGLETPYKEVAAAMHQLVVSHPITDLYRPTEPAYGAESTKKLLEDGSVHRFNHFYGKVAKRHQSPTPDKAKGDFRTTVQVFERGLTELKPEAIAQVLELIESNTLYRGAEHKQAVLAFRTMQEKYLSLSQDGHAPLVRRDIMPWDDANSPERNISIAEPVSRKIGAQNVFLWENATSPAARFRNTVIGTLVQDLSEGVDLERAVASFEQKVAPTNYKRTTALITSSMVKAAMATLKSLDREDAVDRRFANIKDITINNVLWADASAQAQMKGLEALLLDSIVQDVDTKAQNISIDDFMQNILPKAQGLEVYLKSPHLSHLMSITAPQHKDSGNLFKWSNDFAWSYNGNITDSITEKVKNAGGNVNAKVRVSLAWYNYDDLDLECEPPIGRVIYFGNKQDVLDVDMNAGRGHTREPVENLSWTSLQDGKYIVNVNQFRQRETTDVGFSIQLAYSAGVFNWSFPQMVREDITKVLEFTVKDGELVSYTAAPQMVPGLNSQDVWGLQTEKFARVQTVMHSPNYWDDNATGNKHWFFILEGCRNPDPTRGIYNEFLSNKLEEHRKVFEVLGAKTMCQPTDDQLSGVGFSSTKKDKLTVAVTSNGKRRQYNIQF